MLYEAYKPIYKLYMFFKCLIFQQFSFPLGDYLKASSLDIWIHRCQLFCHNQGIYLDEYMQVGKH